MATLQSPGVSVTVQDDTITSTSGVGTVPLYIFATAQDKLVSGSSAIATGTTKANAGKLQLITSPKNVLETYGSPIFQMSEGSVIQGDELNEVGLHGLYSYMGASNRAYALRADIDLASLQPQATAPTGPVSNGTLWLDTTSSQVEAYVSKTATPASFYDWVLKPVRIVNQEHIEDVDTTGLNVNDIVLRNIPSTGQMLVYVFGASGLEQIETYLSPINKVPTVGGVWIRQGYTKNGANYFGTRFVVKRYASLTNVWNDVPVYTGNSFYEVEAQSGMISNSYIASIFDQDSYSFSMYMNSAKGALVSRAAIPLGENPAQTATADGSMTFSFLNKVITVRSIRNGEVISTDNVIANLNQSADLINAGFNFTNVSGLVVTSKNGYSFRVSQTGPQLTFTPVELAKLSTDGTINYSLLNVSNIRVSPSTPTSIARDGTYWFDFSNSDSLTVTLYVADYFTSSWVKVLDSNKYIQLDEPAADRDYWVKPLSQGADGYVFYRNVGGEWVSLDDTDQSTLNGVLFEDFNAGQVPSAVLYQNGMLAVDMSNTEGVVKVMKNGVWTVSSGVAINGAGLFGRNAQRAVIVRAMASAIISNEDIRSETIDFNLMCAPGYVELLDELVTLNVDRRETAFIVTDVPARLKPTGTDITRWASNADNAPSNGSQGRITRYAYAAQYMGWGLGTNVDGTEVTIPGSSIAMRTYAYSDSVSYVWFPPAGTARGVVNNASSIGFINDESEYQPVVYSPGQRDAMYINRINPIAMRPNRGLIVYGDNTLSPNGDNSALGSVNVARLVVYIRRQIELLAEPFLFGLNTPSTRQAFAGVVTNFLAEIARLDGLYDFLVVCDESNNTTERINRKEMWMDIAIVPTRSINYIYVPMRIQNSIK